MSLGSTLAVRDTAPPRDQELNWALTNRRAYRRSLIRNRMGDQEDMIGRERQIRSTVLIPGAASGWWGGILGLRAPAR